MGHGPGMLQRSKDEEIGIVIESYIPCGIVVLTFKNLELKHRRRIDWTSVGRG